MKQGKPNQLDEVLQKGRKILDYFNTNLYESTMNINSSPLLPADKNYSNPFTTGKNLAGHEFDTLDRVELLHYSISSKLGEKDNYDKERHEISQSEQSIIEGGNNNLNFRDFDNFILKIEDLIILDEKTLSNLNKNGLVYIECKVPLFKGQEAQMFYDTFK
jgi:hypothetical protein